VARLNAASPHARLPDDPASPPPAFTPPLGVTPVDSEGTGAVDVDVELDGDTLDDGDVDGEPDGEDDVDGEVDGDGDGLDVAGHVCVRLKKSAVPLISAVAPLRVNPAGVTIHAFDVAGPPLEKLPGSADAVMVTVPFAPKSAVTDTKSPLTLWLPGRTKTHTSWPGNGPPPWFGSQACESNPAAVVGTLPGLILIAASAHAGDPIATATAAPQATRPIRTSSDARIFVPS
jgi:hypothetical protein